MNLRATMIRARIAKLEKELAKEECKEADGASMVRACGKTCADDSELPEPPAEIKASERRASVRAAMEKAIRRRAMRKAMERKAGAEDKIDQEYLTDVEGITHTPAGVVPSIRKMRSAVASLDRLADKLERQGKVALAYRVDRVTDELESRIAKYENRAK